MEPAEYLDFFESYLQSAPVLHSATHEMGGGGHPGSFVSVLVGGVGVLVKTDDTTGEAPIMIRREVAAWRLARLLGWSEMMAATVLRADVPSLQSGEPVSASAQVLWPMNQPGLALEHFPESDVWRAAVFDALVLQSDRNSSNWLAVPQELGAARLKLIDHGYAFSLQRGGLNSPFYEAHRGEQIPDDLRAAIDRVPYGELEPLLPDDEFVAFGERAGSLVANGVLNV